MKLYHGTNSSNVESIRLTGIHPRKGLGNWIIAQSLEGFVYLTNSRDMAAFYASKAASQNNSNPIVISLSIDENNLYPDENYFLESYKSHSKEEVENAQQKVLLNKNKWNKSLESNNNVSHYGEIGIESIIDYEDVSNHGWHKLLGSTSNFIFDKKFFALLELTNFRGIPIIITEIDKYNIHQIDDHTFEVELINGYKETVIFAKSQITTEN